MRNSVIRIPQIIQTDTFHFKSNLCYISPILHSREKHSITCALRNTTLGGNKCQEPFHKIEHSEVMWNTSYTSQMTHLKVGNESNLLLSTWLSIFLQKQSVGEVVGVETAAEVVTEQPGVMRQTNTHCRVLCFSFCLVLPAGVSTYESLPQLVQLLLQ